MRCKTNTINVSFRLVALCLLVSLLEWSLPSLLASVLPPSPGGPGGRWQ